MATYNKKDNAPVSIVAEAASVRFASRKERVQFSSHATTSSNVS